MAKYAFLFSGGVNGRYNYDRYANDLGFAYKVLTNKLQYSAVTVMYSDGRSLIYDKLSINTVAAKRDKFLSHLNGYSKVITKNDIFTFIASNHGGENGELFTWNDNCIEKNEIIDALNSIDYKKIIILGQCYGGNYTNADVNIKNSVIISANTPNEPSYGKLKTDADGNYCFDTSNNYDEFLYNFFSYYNGCYPCGKSLYCDKTENTVSAAYEYSKKYDFYLNGVSLGNRFIKEVPCIRYNLIESSDSISI